MIIGTVKSKNDISIRLTRERWLHIITSHPELKSGSYELVLNTVKNPKIILRGDVGELLAVKKITRKNLWLVVPYKEVNVEDGFVLTAYITTDYDWLLKKEIIWNKR